MVARSVVERHCGLLQIQLGWLERAAWRAIPDKNGRAPVVTLLSHEGISEFALSDHSVAVSVFSLNLPLSKTSRSKSRSEDSKRDSIHAVFKQMSVSNISKEVLREVLELDCKFTKAAIDKLFQAVPFTES